MHLPTTRVKIAAEGVSITKSASVRSLSNVSLMVSTAVLPLCMTTVFVFLPSSSASEDFVSPALEERIFDANFDFDVLFLDDFVFFFPVLDLLDFSFLFC